MSILLTNPYAVTINAISVENDITGACTGMTVDFIAHSLTYTFQVGTLIGSPPQLDAGTYAQRDGQSITATINLDTGTYYFSQGG